MKLVKISWVLVLALLAVSCGGSDGPKNRAGAPPPPQVYTYSAPDSQPDGWELGHIADQNVDQALIEELMSRVINAEFIGIDSISVARNGVLFLDENLRTSFDEYDAVVNNTRLDRHILHSVTKSFTSALIGIAIDKEFITGTDVPFYSMFTYPGYENWDDRKGEITLEHALAMQFGLSWDEATIPYGEPGNSLYDLSVRTADISKGLLDLPVAADPGTSFVYNTAGSISIGQALENSTGIPMRDFAEIYLFSPLQITDIDWAETGTGLPNGGSGLFLTSREMAKFGQLYVDKGKWNNEQVISEEWVDRSIAKHNVLAWSDTSGYGYQWWLDNFPVANEQIESFSARGYGGQFIFCVPSLELVVAFTGRNYGNIRADQVFLLMQNFIIPAMLEPM